VTKEYGLCTEIRLCLSLSQRVRKEKYMKKHPVLSFFYALVSVFVAAALGSVFTMSAIPVWYARVTKPFFSPPNWIFGPVWTLLYICMAIALWLVWNSKTKKKEKSTGVKYFYIQLALNSLWSILFFGLHDHPKVF
jgi:benzodiazapine receptor